MTQPAQLDRALALRSKRLAVRPRVLGGWQLGGVFEASTALPFTPAFGGDPLGANSSDPGMDVPNVITGPGCESRFGGVASAATGIATILCFVFLVLFVVALIGHASRGRIA